MTNKIKEDKLLEDIFQITLKKERVNNFKEYLDSYCSELNENNEELYLTTDNIYFFLIHKIADLDRKKKNCLSYLCSCSMRALDKETYFSVNYEDRILIKTLSEDINNQILNIVIVYLENLDVFPCGVKIPYKKRLNVFFEFLKGSCTDRFLKGILNVIKENNKCEEEYTKQIKKFFNPIIDLILENFKLRNFVFPKNDIAVLFKFLTTCKELSELIMNHKSVFLHLKLDNRIKDNLLEETNTTSSCSNEDLFKKKEKQINTLAPNDSENNITHSLSYVETVTSDLDLNIPFRSLTNNINNRINRNNTKTSFSTYNEINVCGYTLQCNSLLGVLTSPTILSMPNIMNRESNGLFKYFFNNNTNSIQKFTAAQLTQTYTLIRNNTNWILENCVDIFKNLLNTNAHVRKKVLIWINCILLSNEKKNKLMYNFASYPQSLDDAYGFYLKLLGENSYGFCLNIFYILLYLCKPITINKVNDMDAYFFLRDDEFSKFLLKNITNQSSFEDKSNVEKIKKNIINTNNYKNSPKFITCIFWMTFKSLNVFLKPALDELIKIAQGIAKSKNRDLYYVHIHAWRSFLQNPTFIELLLHFINLAMYYFLHVVYLYDINGNIDTKMQNLLKENNNNISQLVMKCCPPPNEKYYNMRLKKKSVNEENNENIDTNIYNEESNNVNENSDGLYASPQFSIIPTFFLGDLLELICLLSDVDYYFKGSCGENFLHQLDKDLFNALSVFVMLSEHHVKSIHLRCDSVPSTYSALSKINSCKYILDESIISKKYIIECYTKVFIASQKGAYAERMKTRVIIVESLNDYFTKPYYVNQFTELVINDNNLFVHFMHLLLNDASYLIEEVVSYMSEIKRREEKKKKKKDNKKQNNINDYVDMSRNINNQNNENIQSSNYNSINGAYNESSEIDEFADGIGLETAALRARMEDSMDEIEEGTEANAGIDSYISNMNIINLTAKTRSIIKYCYKTCIFLKLLCKNNSKNIISSNTIRSQIVTCLNCYFHYLVGPESKNLKVEKKEQYNFRPELWLSSIVKCYLYLLDVGKEEEKLLISEIANEGRYYKCVIFNRALYICKNKMLINKKDLIKFDQFCQYIIDMKEEVELFNDVEIPDQYLDPILQDIMLDPVILPTSGIVVDRKNIERHLMSEPNDPFNRSPLTKEQLIPNNELKEEINKYIEKIRIEKKEKKKLEMKNQLEEDMDNELFEDNKNYEDNPKDEINKKEVTCENNSKNEI